MVIVWASLQILRSPHYHCHSPPSPPPPLQHHPPHLYYLYRTSDGFLGLGTSTDGGRTFASPLFAEYSRHLPGSEGYLKNPRGPITPRRLRNGRYLLLYFNRGGA